MANINIDTFWNDFSIKIVRFDPTFPLDAPDSYVVGFHVMHKTNQRSKYSDMRQSYEDVKGLTDEQIVRKAWASLSATFEAWAATVVPSGTSSILGSEFVPM